MGNTGKSYLSRVRFEPKLLRSRVASYITNIRVVLLLAVTIALLGLVSYTQLPKRLNPEVKIPIVTVVTALPGASPTDVESLITIPIEDRLRSLKGVDTVSSSSVDNVSVITIQFLSTIDRDKAKDDTQAAVNEVTNLPSDAVTPKVKALDFEDQPIWTFALTSDSNYPDLMRTSRDLKKKIEDLSKVDRVVTTGFDEQEIRIVASTDALSRYNLNPFSLMTLIKKARTSYPAGTVTAGAYTFSVTIDPQVESVSDIRSLPLSIQGHTVPLGSLATVTEVSKPDQPDSYVATNNTPSHVGVTFSVYKTSGSNIDESGEQVKKTVNEFLSARGNTYHLTTLSNTSEEITKQFSDLLHEFRTTILLVMGVLLLFLGLRQALISSLTVPLTFLSAFFFMHAFGMSINFLSLFSFLLSLGLLVDDTIVTVSAMTSYFGSGKFSPVETGVLVWRDTIIPIWSTTITTIWSFVPLLITSGIIGEFIKPIPIVVSVTMLSSTAIAVLITLPLMIVLLRPKIAPRVTLLIKILVWLVGLILVGSLVSGSPVLLFALLAYIIFTLITRVSIRHFQASYKKSRARSTFHRIEKLLNHGLVDVTPFAQWYKKIITHILASKRNRRRVLIGVSVYSLLCFALLPLGYVKNEFFPKTDQNEIFVRLELPAGTRLEKTRSEALTIADNLRHTKETQFITVEVGKDGGVGFARAGTDSDNIAFFSLRLTDKEKRHIPSYTIAEDIRSQWRTFTDGKISVVEASGGPPAGADIQLKLLGNDLVILRHQAERVAEFLRTQNGITNVDISMKEGTSKLVFVPDGARLSQFGIGRDQVASTLRTYASGFPLDSIALTPGSDEKTDITLRTDNGIADAQSLSTLMLGGPKGNIPLMALGEFVPKPNPTSITRENFERTISVTAAMRPGFSTSETSRKLQDFAKTMNLPTGYTWKTGGVNEENAKSIQSILRAMILSAILILITMVLQFGSFRQSIIVLIVIPLAVSSVFLLFALTGTPLSFPALIGVLSLFGIVVTNSMFIVDKINLNRREGMPFTEAIADAGASRMEPIILTKLCTVFGLLPITLADPLWRGLGGAIISGLLLASTIMLLFIPVLYYSWMKPEKDVV